MTMNRLVIAVGAVLALTAAALPGCAPTLSPPSAATQPPPTGAPDDRQQAQEAAEAARRAERELLAARIDGPAPPACERACGLQTTICDLATRICAIADRHPDDAQLGTLCADGRARCARARAAVSARCPCPVR